MSLENYIFIMNCIWNKLIIKDVWLFSVIYRENGADITLYDISTCCICKMPA